MNRSRLLPWVLVLSVLVFVPSAGAVAYRVSELGTLGGDSAKAYHINDAGQILGSAKTAYGDYHTFLYTAGAMQDLGHLGFTGFNNNADIIGTYKNASNQTRAALYPAGNPEDRVDLGTLGGTTSFAYGINNLGHVVGESWLTNNAGCHAFVYRDGIESIGSLAGLDGISTAYAINDSGVVVGQTDVPETWESHAFLYDGQMHDLGTLGGTYGIASDVNSSGVAVGYSYVDLAFTGYHAFLYDGQMRDLGTLGGSYSEAYAINDAGQIIGESEVDRELGISSFFLYENGQMKDLQHLINPADGWRLDGIRDINDSGQIVGYGVKVGVWLTQALLLTPLEAGDANGDGMVTDADYTIWADNYGQSGTWWAGDFNEDGVVTDADYTLWADHYGSGVGVPAPEPATVAVLAIGVAAMLMRRRTL